MKREQSQFLSTNNILISGVTNRWKTHTFFFFFFNLYEREESHLNQAAGIHIASSVPTLSSTFQFDKIPFKKGFIFI